MINVMLLQFAVFYFAMGWACQQSINLIYQADLKVNAPMWLRVSIALFWPFLFVILVCGISAIVDGLNKALKASRGD